MSELKIEIEAVGWFLTNTGDEVFYVKGKGEEQPFKVAKSAALVALQVMERELGEGTIKDYMHGSETHWNGRSFGLPLSFEGRIGAQKIDLTEHRNVHAVGWDDDGFYVRTVVGELVRINPGSSIGVYIAMAERHGNVDLSGTAKGGEYRWEYDQAVTFALRGSDVLNVVE